MKRGRKIKQSQMCLTKEVEVGMKKRHQKARKTASVKRTIAQEDNKRRRRSKRLNRKEQD